LSGNLFLLYNFFMILDFENINLSKVKSKFVHEYVSFKTANKDFILFFQIGQFFETYFQDAKLFSDITGVALTTKYIKEVGEIAQAGVPYNHVDLYIKKLLAENKKICICEQFMDENEIYYRKITRRYTKGTIFENEFLDSFENNYILLAKQNHDKNYSIAYADTSTGQFYKTTTTKDELKIEIEKVSPNELLIFKSQEKIFKKILQKYNTTLIDATFEAKNIEESLFDYCKEMQQNFLVSFDKIIEYSPCSYLLMDNATRKSLELIRTQRYLKKKGSLFHFLNKTKTSMGARLLKKYLNEPLLQIEQIEKRQEAIEELLKNKSNLDILEKILENFCDLSRLSAKLSNTTVEPKDLLQLSNNANVISELKDFCETFKSKQLKINQENYISIKNLSNEVRNTLNNNITKSSDWLEIIKDGCNFELDKLKQELKLTYTSLKKFEEKQKKILNSDKVKINHSKILGYYIEVPSSKQIHTPNDYLKKQALTNFARYTTIDLKEFEEKIYNLTYKIDNISKELYIQLKQKAKIFTDSIRDIAKDIARIDVLFSIAKCSFENNFTKPIFNKEKIEIINGYHPELINSNITIVKNNTNLNNGNMIILTGANMSGKSTYLKQNAIISILSQIGSYVPADKANVTIVDKIFFRQGSLDDLTNNNSSFMIEMEDLKFILDNTTNNSLILLDEPAKSTNAKEGGAIAKAYCEYLLNHHQTKTMVVTHNTFLTTLEYEYTKAHNYMIEIDEKSNFYTRKILKGIATKSFALNTAELANLPKEIISKAKAYLNTANQ